VCILVFVLFVWVSVCFWQTRCNVGLVGISKLWGEIGSDYSEFWHRIIFNPLIFFYFFFEDIEWEKTLKMRRELQTF